MEHVCAYNVRVTGPLLWFQYYTLICLECELWIHMQIDRITIHEHNLNAPDFCLLLIIFQFRCNANSSDNLWMHSAIWTAEMGVCVFKFQWSRRRWSEQLFADDHIFFISFLHFHEWIILNHWRFSIGSVGHPADFPVAQSNSLAKTIILFDARSTLVALLYKCI